MVPSNFPRSISTFYFSPFPWRAVISVGCSIVENILIAALLAFPTSGPNWFAYPLANAPKFIAKMQINISIGASLYSLRITAPA
jgi:hypothetical protein